VSFLAAAVGDDDWNGLLWIHTRLRNIKTVRWRGGRQPGRGERRGTWIGSG
jgi:hypothetical protein